VFVFLLIGSLFFVGGVLAAPYAAIGEDCTGVYWSKNNFGTSTRPPTTLEHAEALLEKAKEELEKLQADFAYVMDHPKDYPNEKERQAKFESLKDQMIKKGERVNNLENSITLREKHGADNSDGSINEDSLIAASREYCGGDCYSCGVRMLSWSGISSTGIVCGLVRSGKKGGCDDDWYCDGKGKCVTDDCHVTKAYWTDSSGKEVESIVNGEVVNLVAETSGCDDGKKVFFNITLKREGSSNILNVKNGLFMDPFSRAVFNNKAEERISLKTIEPVTVFDFFAQPILGTESDGKVSPELISGAANCFKENKNHDCKMCVYSEGKWNLTEDRSDHDSCHICRDVVTKSGADIPLLTRPIPVASDLLAICPIVNKLFTSDGTILSTDSASSETKYMKVPVSEGKCNRYSSNGEALHGECDCGECVEPSKDCSSSNPCGSTCKNENTFLRWRCIDGKCADPVEEIKIKNWLGRRVFCWEGKEKLLVNKHEPHMLMNVPSFIPLIGGDTYVGTNLYKAISDALPVRGVGASGVAISYTSGGRFPLDYTSSGGIGLNTNANQLILNVGAAGYGGTINLGKLFTKICSSVYGKNPCEGAV